MFGDIARETSCRSICYANPGAIQKHAVAPGLLHRIPLLLSLWDHSALNPLFVWSCPGLWWRCLQIAFPLDVHTWSACKICFGHESPGFQNFNLSRTGWLSPEQKMQLYTSPNLEQSIGVPKSWEINHDHLICSHDNDGLSLSHFGIWYELIWYR